MKKSIIVLISIFMAFLLSAEVIDIDGSGLSVELLSSDAGSSVLEVQIGSFEREAVEMEGDTWWRVGIAGESRTVEAGSPELARIVRNLAIADDGLMEVEVISSEYVEYEMSVAPSRGVILRNIDPDTVPYVRGERYAEAGYYPGELATLATPYIFRDVRGIALDIKPMQYNPVSGVLRVYTNLTIAVNNTGIDNVNIKQNREHYQREFVSLYARHFINWEEYLNLQRYEQISEAAGRMIVISHGDFMDEMEPFLEWKNQKGIETTMVDVSTIGNNSSSIQNFLDTEYEDGNLVWVLLVGDASQLATKSYSGAGGDPQYSYMEGNDSYSEFFIGRFSAETAAQVETQVLRSIHYERDVIEGDWMQKGVGIASAQGAGQGHYGEADYVHMGYIRDDLLDYGYLEVDEIYDTNGGNATMVSNALNEGRGIINYCGHGSNTTWVPPGFPIPT
jgi:hypothetical protein